MKLKTVFKKLLAKYTISNLLDEFLKIITWDKLFQQLCNRCCHLSYHAKGKAKKREWMRQARIFHRALDEIKLDIKKKSCFKIKRQDICYCKCGKKFIVEASIEKNIKFNAEKGFMVISCPFCKKQESV